jgi:hypothetical protein
MNQWIVITTVYPPTEGVRRFSQLEGWRTIVVGDKKTPTGWACEGIRFTSSKEQETMPWKITKHLPWNHYCRKMIGYLCAMEAGAHIICDTDDDNIPMPGWGFPEFHATVQVSAPGKNFINIYKHFSDQHIWPRGFPLNHIGNPDAILFETDFRKETVRVGAWQGLVDGDPDVDAIYRLTVNAPCTFKKKDPVVLDMGTVSPFNSQNTAFTRELFPLLYLPAYVTFRFTDILRGFIAQPIMWQHRYRLGFTSATVVQKRNPHDPMKDFVSELPCYLHAERIVDIVGGVAASGNSVAENLFSAYEHLHRQGIVEKRELDLLEAWLKDIG